MKHFDLFVLGAGSGGVRAARQAAARGLEVAIAEERFLGGTCVNVGCVPKKLMVLASEFREHFEDASAYGWEVGSPTHDWPRLKRNRDAEIARLNAIYRGLLQSSGVHIVEQRAVLKEGPIVATAEGDFSADILLIAVGGESIRPDIPGAELALLSDGFFELDALPERAVLVGGGYIAVEFAGVLEGLGSEVTLVHRGPLFLRGFELELRRSLAQIMRVRGVDLRFDTEVRALEPTPSGVRMSFDNGPPLDSDAPIFAIGRRPHTDDLGLETIGVEVDADGAIVVDEFSRTTAPGVWAVGDCTNRFNLTPVAIAEAMAMVRSSIDGELTAPNYDSVPTAVFSQPPLAAVGLTEEAAKAAGHEVHCYRSGFRPLRQTLTRRDEPTEIRLVVDAVSDRVLGVHILGHEAPEILQAAAIAVHMGARKSDFDATIGIHPTSAEELVTMRVRD